MVFFLTVGGQYFFLIFFFGSIPVALFTPCLLHILFTPLSCLGSMSSKLLFLYEFYDYLVHALRASIQIGSSYMARVYCLMQSKAMGIHDTIV
jgi:hypothetical protein